MGFSDQGRTHGTSTIRAFFEPDGTTYSGEGSGLIRIPLEDHNQDPHVVSLLSVGYLDLHMTVADELGQDNNEPAFPTHVGYLYDTDAGVLVLPQGGDLELWVRTDEIFFVDLPTAVERRAIWTIQLASKATAGNGLATIGTSDVEKIVVESENYSGAEIEQAVIVAL